MTRVICYLEGKSDRLGLESLFQDFLRQKRNEGVDIRFFEVNHGDRKRELVTSIPRKAANILRNDIQAQVAVMPDLYPPNKGFPHKTWPEMEAGIRLKFNESGGLDPRLHGRFHVFCFKYEFEVLLLAAEGYLGPGTWYEDLNHELNPKRRLEQRFEQRGRVYNAAVDAPEILSRIDYRDLAARCPQAFEPFVRWLEGLS